MKNEGLYLRMKSEGVLRMTGLIMVLILHSSFFSLRLSAQTFTDRLRQQEDGKGVVTITQSPEIEELVNNAQLVPQKPQGTQQPTTQPQHPTTAPANQNTTATPNTPNTPNTNNPSAAQKPTTTPQTPATEETPVDTSKKIMRGGHKVQGYRVQVFSGGNSRDDRQKAERIGSAMKSHFPDQPVYVHFYSPSWKCRIGNYRTVEEARLILSQVKQLGYSSACIVKGTITVQ